MTGSCPRPPKKALMQLFPPCGRSCTYSFQTSYPLSSTMLGIGEVCGLGVRIPNASHKFLRQLTLNLNTWCVIVEEEAGDIYIPNLSMIFFELDCRTFYAPHMPATCRAPTGTGVSTGSPNPTPTPAPSPVPARTATCPVQSMWALLSGLMLINGICLYHYIS